MGTNEFELRLLALLSALLCGGAFLYGDLLATAIFAALTCATGVARRRLACRPSRDAAANVV
jgi:hypothetical protein